MDHKTYSFVSDYPVISLVRQFEGKGNLNNIYIYIESGYRDWKITSTVGKNNGCNILSCFRFQPCHI